MRTVELGVFSEDLWIARNDRQARLIYENIMVAANIGGIGK